MTRPTFPPAIVVGAGLNGLGVVRALAALGAPVWLAEASFRHPTARTRLARRHAVRSLSDTRLVDDILALAKTLPARPVLFLTQEASVRLVAERREEVEAACAIELPATETILRLTTKQGFQEEAERLGAPVPRTRIISSAEELEAVRGFTFPVILKPNERHPDYDRHFRKAYRFEAFEALQRSALEILPRYPHLVVQEWVEGDDTEIYFCLQYRPAGGAAPAASFCGRKNRSHPPMVGGTASCTIAPEQAWAELIALTQRFFNATGVVGLASMEFKRRPDGRFVMIEPTIGRSDFQEEVAAWHGVNIPGYGYAHLAGLPLPTLRRRARPCVWFDPDAEAMSRAAAPGVPDLPGRRRDAYFDLSDPFPWLARQLDRISRRLGLGREG